MLYREECWFQINLLARLNEDNKGKIVRFFKRFFVVVYPDRNDIRKYTLQERRRKRKNIFFFIFVLDIRSMCENY